MFTYHHRSIDLVEWKARCSVPDDLPCFQGHFPDRPILPAIAQLEMLTGFVSQVRGFACYIERSSSLKFIQPILPGDEVVLELSVADDEMSFNFNISCDGKVASRGQLTFKGAT